MVVGGGRWWVVAVVMPMRLCGILIVTTVTSSNIEYRSLHSYQLYSFGFLLLMILQDTPKPSSIIIKASFLQASSLMSGFSST